MDLVQRIRGGRGGVVLFAMTPPRASTADERVAEIAATTMDRLRPLGLNGLVLYDIDDESERNPEERPFPYSPTLDPADYLARHLTGWGTPVVVYRAVGKHAVGDLASWSGRQDPARTATVLVGASSGRSRPATTLVEGRRAVREHNPDLLVGGVAIPERHARRGDEHLRLIEKQQAGTG